MRNRREILTGAVAVAALAGGGVALSIGAADPVFAAIENHRAVNAEFNSIEEPSLSDHVAYAEFDRLQDEWNGREIDAAYSLFDPGPSTLAGVVALADYIGKVLASGDVWPDREPEPGDGRGHAIAFERDAIRVMATALKSLSAEG